MQPLADRFDVDSGLFTGTPKAEWPVGLEQDDFDGRAAARHTGDSPTADPDAPEPPTLVGSHCNPLATV